MQDLGWTVKVTELPKKKWILLSDRVEFDNEEEALAETQRLRSTRTEDDRIAYVEAYKAQKKLIYLKRRAHRREKVNNEPGNRERDIFKLISAWMATSN